MKRGVQVTVVSGGRVVESTRIPCLDDGEQYKFLGVLESVIQEDKLVLEFAAKEKTPYWVWYGSLMSKRRGRCRSIFKEAVKCAEEFGLELDLELTRKRSRRRCGSATSRS